MLNESNRMECKGDDGMVCENDGIVFGGGEGWCLKGMGCLVCIF